MALVLEQHSHQDSPEVASATLGDVLYADRSKSPVPEADWVRLVRAIAAGDQLALHALYERAHRLVFTLSVRMTGNRETAEELTLDVFYEVWRRAPDYDPENGTVLGWIMNLARSRTLDRLRLENRRKRVAPAADAFQPEQEATDTQERVQLEQQCQLLLRALRNLPAGEREAIETAFFAELTHAQAAIRLNQPLGTVKTRIRSALQKLRQALAAPGAVP